MPARRLLLGVLFVCPALGQGPALVQQSANSGSRLAALTVTLPRPSTPGSLLVVCHDSTSGGNSIVTGGGVSRWTLCRSSLPEQDNSEIWAGIVVSAAISIRLQLGGSPNDAAAVVTEWSGFAAGPEFAGVSLNGSGGAGSPAMSGSVYADAGDLVIAMVGTHTDGQSIGPPTNGFTDLLRPGPTASSVMAAAYRLPSAPGSWSTTWTFSNPSVWASACVAFRPLRPARVGGDGEEAAAQLRVDPATGNWIVAGRTASFGRGDDLLFARFDPGGNLLSASAWGGARDDEARGLDLAAGAAPGIYVAGGGSSFGSGAGDRDVLLLRYDYAGALQWAAQWATDGSLDEHAEGVAVDAAGRAFVVGTVRAGSRRDDALLLRFAPVPAGSQPATDPVAVSSGGSGDDRLNGCALHEAAVTSLFVAGSTTSFGHGNQDVLVQKYDDGLVLQWTRTWGGHGIDEALGAAVAADGSVYVAGSTQSGSTPPDALLLKWSPSGDLVWSARFGGPGADRLRSVLVDGHGDVLVAGATATAAGGPDGLLAKLDGDGNLLWAQSWNTAGTDESAAAAVAPSGELLVAGAGTDAGGLVLLSGLAFERSTSGAPVTRPEPAAAAAPTGRLHLPSATPPAGPGLPSGDDVFVQRLSAATTGISSGCAAAPATTGGPVLSFDTVPILGGSARIRRTSLQATPLTALVLGASTAPRPLTSFGGTVAGATVCVEPATALAFAGTSPTLYTLQIPPTLVFLGRRLYAQWIDFPELGNSAVGRLQVGW